MHASDPSILAPLVRARARSQMPAQIVRTTRRGDVALLTIDNGPLNICSASVRRELVEAIRAIEQELGLVAVVLLGSGDNFLTGDDLSELGSAPQRPELPEVMTTIEQCSLPIVAAMRGAALGAGFELALACDGRICDSGTVIGLSQVALGMIPGGGGTQRLPRLVGRAMAVDIICTSRRVEAAEAFSLKLVDRVVEGDLVERAIEFARACAPFKRSVRDIPMCTDDEAAYREAARAALRAGRRRPPVVAALSAIDASATMPRDAAIAHEQKLFNQLRTSGDARALRYQFFAGRRAARGALGVVPPASLQPVFKAGVVGGGDLGLRVAKWLVSARIEVTVVEKNRRSMRLVSRCLEAMIPQFSCDLASLADCDFVIEAVPEDYEAKVGIFIALDALLKKSCVLATTSSRFDIDALASATSRPESVCGMHFLPSANAASVVEIVRTSYSSAATVKVAAELARRLQKTPIVAGNALGFIGHRIFSALLMQCDSMVEQGANRGQIDSALQAFGFDVGPFALMAVIPDLGDLATRPCSAASKPGKAVRAFEDAEIVQRALLAMVNEALCILEDGVALAPGDIDVLVVCAYGFPAWEGGPLFWARQCDADELAENMGQFLRAERTSRRRGDLRLLKRFENCDDA